MLNLKTSSRYLYFLLALGALCLFAPAVKAQDRIQRKIDSLTTRIAGQAPDTNKFHSLIALTELYAKFGYGPKALIIGQQALRLSQKLRWLKGEALAYIALGGSYHSTYANYDNAMANYRPALAIARKLKDMRLEGAIMKNIQFIEALVRSGYSWGQYRSNYIAALNYARQELALAESVNDAEYIIAAYTDLGSLYMYLNDDQKALHELQSGLDYGLKSGKKRDILDIFYYLIDYYIRKKDFAAAERTSFQTLQMMDEQKIKQKEGIYRDLIEIYTGEKDYKKAFYYSKQVLQHQESIRRSDVIARAYYLTALVYMQAPDSILAAEGILPAKRYELAVEGFNHTLQILARIGDSFTHDLAPLTYSGLSSAYARLHDYPRAYDAFKTYVTKSDSMRTLTNEGEFSRQAARADFLKQQDSLIYAKKLTDGQLEQQKLQTTRQQQALLLNQQQLMLANSQKNIEQLKVLKTQADLQAEQNRRKANEQQLKASQKEKQAANVELTAKRNQSYYFMAGIAALLLLSFFIATNYINQRKANRKITEANHLLNEQQEEITAQRDTLAETITELKQTQTQLIQAEKLASLGELTAGIAHEIQNPLNFVNNFSEVSVELLEELKEEAEAGNTADVLAIATDLVQNLKKINHHGKRADGIVKGMLEHSRTSSGQKELTDLNKLADEYLRLAYHGAKAKDNSFDTGLKKDLDQNLALVSVIPQDIGRVLLNLYNNAFYTVQQKSKSTGGDYEPEVSLITAMENGQAVVKVKDNGNGIPKDIQDKIMQPFFTTKPPGQGTGLGLSLSYDIIAKGHGGSIKVESKENEGAIFILSFPV